MEQFQTLVISYNFVPLSKVPWTRAITWLVSGRVEMLEEYEGHEIHSPSRVFPMPSVVRFLRKVKGFFRKTVKFNRKNVWLRDKASCQYCGHRVSLEDFTFDHVRPRRLLGKTCWENVVVACYPCNQRKADKTLREANMHLLHEPVQPKHLPFGDIFCGGNIPDSWKSFLGSVSYWYEGLDKD